MNGITFSGCDFVSKASCNLSLIIRPASVVAPIAKGRHDCFLFSFTHSISCKYPTSSNGCASCALAAESKLLLSQLYLVLHSMSHCLAGIPSDGLLCFAKILLHISSIVGLKSG